MAKRHSFLARITPLFHRPGDPETPEVPPDDEAPPNGNGDYEGVEHPEWMEPPDIDVPVPPENVPRPDGIMGPIDKDYVIPANDGTNWYVAVPGTILPRLRGGGGYLLKPMPRAPRH
jgi:hypothetical protein